MLYIYPFRSSDSPKKFDHLGISGVGSFYLCHPLFFALAKDTTSPPPLTSYDLVGILGRDSGNLY